VKRLPSILPALSVLLVTLPLAARATDSDAESADPSTLTIIGTTPVPGATLDIDKVPSNVETVRASDLTRNGTASLTRALNSELGSININDTLADPFQPDIFHRGFDASPVLGTPQGLAVYQNGVRINEAFGDAGGSFAWDSATSHQGGRRLQHSAELERGSRADLREHPVLQGRRVESERAATRLPSA
jgi:TonB-dependent Receptor Plug Domain